MGVNSLPVTFHFSQAKQDVVSASADQAVSQITAGQTQQRNASETTDWCLCQLSANLLFFLSNLLSLLATTKNLHKYGLLSYYTANPAKGFTNDKIINNVSEI